MSGTKNFVQFSKPFIDALKETFSVMAQTEITAHSPRVKNSTILTGQITASIGMNGKLETPEGTKDFKGLLIISWPEDVYIKFASRMLFEEYTQYCDEISDSGAEVANIVMGNAKNGLTPMGYKIEMAIPSTIRGNNMEIKYPPGSTVIAITITADIGDFALELCYQEN